MARGTDRVFVVRHVLSLYERVQALAVYYRSTPHVPVNYLPNVTERIRWTLSEFGAEGTRGEADWADPYFSRAAKELRYRRGGAR